MNKLQASLYCPLMMLIALTAAINSWATDSIEINGDPLKISVTETATPSVFVNQSGSYTQQYYAENSWGSVIWFDGTGYGTGYNNPDGNAVTPVSHSLVDASMIETVVDVGASKVRLTQTFRYVSGTRYIKKTWQLSNISGAVINNMSFYHGGDTYFGGDDSAKGYYDPDRSMVYIVNNDYSAVGYMAFYADNSSPVAHYYEGDYGLGYDYAANNVDLPDTTDSHFIDAGYYLQWQKASLANGEVWTITAYEYWSLGGAVQLIPPQQALGSQGGSVDAVLKLHNLGSSIRNALVTTSSLPAGWRVTFSNSIHASVMVDLADSEVREIAVTIHIPAGATVGMAETIIFDASYIGVSNTEGSNSAEMVVEVTAPAAEINVTANGNTIVSNDSTPSIGDNTDFGEGASLFKTFTIENTGSADLILSDTPRVTISGDDASKFRVTVQPRSPITADNSTDFILLFNDRGARLSSALVTVASNDSDEPRYSFSIQATGANTAPSISGTPATTVAESEAYSFTPAGFDLDGDSLSYSIVNQPPWARFDRATGTLMGVPGFDDAGRYSNIQLTVSDGLLSGRLANFDVTVVNTNRAPTISGTPAASVTEDSTYRFIPAGVDLDGDRLNYSIINKPGWVRFDNNTGVITGRPTGDDLGSHVGISITVTDSLGLSAGLLPFDLQVIGINRPPIILANRHTFAINDKQEIMPFKAVAISDDSERVSLQITFDGDNGTLIGDGLTGHSGVYSIPSVTLNTAQSILQSLTFIPTENQVSTERLVETIFSITVNDGVLERTANESLSVSVLPVNDAPIIYGQTIGVVEGRTTIIKLIAEDFDNDDIYFSLVTPPVYGDLIIDGSVGEYTPDQGYYGPDSFSVVASDDGGSSLDFTVNLKVSALNDDTMAVDDTITLPVNLASNNYELNVLANDNQDNSPELVAVLSLEGHASIKGNKLFLSLENIEQPYFTLVYVIRNSQDKYAKAQVNLIFKNIGPQ